MPDVVEHIACGACGYDLFRQPTGGGCPECGSPVRESIEQRNVVRIDGERRRAATAFGGLLVLMMPVRAATLILLIRAAFSGALGPAIATALLAAILSVGEPRLAVLERRLYPGSDALRRMRIVAA